MTNNELNQYILRYLIGDKTNSAIMLTGAWGTGKSYYIKNALMPFLAKPENGAHQCIVVSLYGLKNTDEISKSIYIESRMRFLTKDSEKITTGMFVAKTVVKGVASFFGVDLSKENGDLKALYESIDLKGKLVILEDLERSGIDILDVLGFVNNLTEQDGAKVLLVANEKEIMHLIPVEENQNGTLCKKSKESTWDYDDKTKKYLKIKEKTISDTIIFQCDYKEAIRQIIEQFDNELLKKYSSNAQLDQVVDTCKEIGIINLRTFVFACQKTNDLYDIIGLESDNNNDYINTIFWGILAFSQKYKTGEKTAWKGTNDFSIELATPKYPLFRSAYDFITVHTFDKSRVTSEIESLKKLRLYDRNKSSGDSDLNTLYRWHLSTDDAVTKAVQSITVRLGNIDDISFYEYGKLALYLVTIKSILGCNIDEAKKLLIENLHDRSEDIDADYIFVVCMDTKEEPNVVDEFVKLKTAMLESLAAKETTIFDFDYKTSSIDSLYESIRTKQGEIFNKKAFASRLDINKLCDMIKACTSEELQLLRDVFFEVYRWQNVEEFLYDDKKTIINLYDKIIELKSFDRFDTIQKKQIGYFAHDLEDIRYTLERYSYTEG